MKFYGYKKCDTCRKGQKYLESLDLEFEFIDITEHPPTEKTLEQILKLTGADFKKLFNTSGVLYREMNIKAKLPKMSKSDALKLLSKNGKLIKRPLAVTNDRATIGFSQASFDEAWGT